MAYKRRLRLQIVLIINFMCNVCFMSEKETRPPKLPERLFEPPETDLQRLVQNHGSYCRIKDSCNSSHWDWDSECFCERCYCEPDCVDNDKCCPKVLADFWTIPIPRTRQECVSLAYREIQSAKYQLMIAECPVAYRRADVVKKCEERNDALVVDYIVPVDDKTTDLTYASKYCAECHSVPEENLVYWSAFIQCGNSTFMSRSYKTVLKDVITTDDCDIVFRHVKYRHDKNCRKVISTCNETGLWETYDNFTDQACRLYQAPYLKKFRNPFCAICNGYKVERHKRDASNCAIVIPAWPSFSALLNFRPAQIEEQEDPQRKCSNDQLYDPVSNVCRDLLCDFGRILDNGSCEPLSSDSRGGCYQFYIQLTPLGEGNSSSNSTRALFTRSTNVDIDSESEAVAAAFEKEILKVTEKHKTDLYFRNFSFYKTEQQAEGTKLAETLYASLFFFIEFFLNEGAFLNDMYDLYEDRNISLLCDFKGMSSEKEFWVNLVNLQKSSTVHGLISPWTGQTMTPFYKTENDRQSKVNCAGQQVLTITSFYFQPFVRLDNSSYTWHINVSGVIIHELNLFIESSMFRETENGAAIFVSAEVFRTAVQKTSAETKMPTPAETEGLVTIILMCISIFCLLITFVTYALFHVLRSQPGINNMILCFCLIIGYLLFMFGLNQVNLDIGCKILGGAVHFSWLFIFFWMSSCSFHMYRVFGSLSKPIQSTNSATLTATYLLYSTLSSSVIIGINIGVTYVTSSGTSYGYGPEKTGMCYIYEPIMTAYTMAIPAIVIIIANLVMFGLVVARFRRITNIQKHVQNDKNYLSIYVKLSTLTGMAWIIAIPMMFLESVVFNYLFIALTCSQGIYLMMAFTCNRRVFKLYSGDYNLKKASGVSVYETHAAATRTSSPSGRSASVVVKSKVQLNHI